VHALGYLQGHAPQAVAGVHAWLAAMLRWLTGSDKGRDEAANGNNHASWWAVHVAAFAAATGEGGVADAAFAHFRDVLLPQQMRPDGSLPRELERTKALSYSLFISMRGRPSPSWRCGAAWTSGISPCRRPLDRPGHRVRAPLSRQSLLWQRPQIDGSVPSDQLCLQMAALRLGLEEAQRINARRREDMRLIRDQG